jgi:hypothetical protein
MNFQFYLEKLFDSDEFNKFIKENKEAFLCSGFFTLDLTGSDNQQHLDYWVPSTEKLYSFKINESPIVMIEAETQPDFSPTKIKDNIDFTMEEIKKAVEKKAIEKEIKNEIQKIILSLQSKDGKDYLLGTVFLSGLGMIKLVLDVDEKKIIEFEKRSFFDMMHVMGKKEE